MIFLNFSAPHWRLLAFSAISDTLTDTTENVQPCVLHTHTSPASIQLLKNLLLPTILQKNKDLEQHSRPNAHLGSEVVSLITIYPEDLAWLRFPSFFASMCDFIYNSLARHLANEELKEKEEKKRKGDDILAEDVRVLKRHCMDGSNHVERVVGESILIEFPTVKSNPVPGETKRIYNLNIEKLSACFRKELMLTCSQWSAAAANMWNCQILNDKLGSEGKYATWLESISTL